MIPLKGLGLYLFYVPNLHWAAFFSKKISLGKALEIDPSSVNESSVLLKEKVPRIGYRFLQEIAAHFNLVEPNERQHTLK